MTHRNDPWYCEFCDSLGWHVTQDPAVANAHNAPLGARLPCPDCNGSGHASFLQAATRTPNYVLQSVGVLQDILEDHPRLPKTYLVSVWYKMYVRDTLRHTKRIIRSKLPK